MAAARSRRIAPLRTVTLESLADLQAFHAALTRRFTLPQVRIALRISPLQETQTALAAPVQTRRDRGLRRTLTITNGQAHPACTVWPTRCSA